MKPRKTIALLILFASSGLWLLPEKVEAQSAIGQLESIGGRKIDRYNSSNGYSNSNSNSSSYVTVRYEKAAKVNSKGTDFFRNGNYKSAVAAFRKALWYNPFDENIKRNYKSAKEALNQYRLSSHVKHETTESKPVIASTSTTRPTISSSPNTGTVGDGRGRGNQNTTVPLMGSAPLTFEERERLRFIKLHGANNYDANASWNTISDGKIGKKPDDHPYIEIGRKFSVSVAGSMPGMAGYVGILAVNIWAENLKTIKDIYDNKPYSSSHTIIRNAYGKTYEDFAEKGIGDYIGGKVYSNTREIGESILVSKGVSPGIAFISEKPKKMAEFTKSIYEKYELVKEGTSIGYDLIKLW